MCGQMKEEPLQRQRRWVRGSQGGEVENQGVEPLETSPPPQKRESAGEAGSARFQMLYQETREMRTKM